MVWESPSYGKDGDLEEVESSCSRYVLGDAVRAWPCAVRFRRGWGQILYPFLVSFLGLETLARPMRICVWIWFSFQEYGRARVVQQVSKVSSN